MSSVFATRVVFATRFLAAARTWRPRWRSRSRAVAAHVFCSDAVVAEAVFTFPFCRLPRFAPHFRPGPLPSSLRYHEELMCRRAAPLAARPHVRTSQCCCICSFCSGLTAGLYHVPAGLRTNSLAHKPSTNHLWHECEVPVRSARSPAACLSTGTWGRPPAGRGLASGTWPAKGWWGGGWLPRYTGFKRRREVQVATINYS